MAPPQDAGTLAVRDVLMRLRKRSGLSLDRLRRTEVDVAPLFELPAVRRYAHLTNLPDAPALLGAVALLARQMPPTERVVVDAELSLGLLREHRVHGIEPALLYAPDLAERRTYLAAHWRELHAALGVADPPPAPSVRTLRGLRGQHAVTALAARLSGASVFDTQALPDPAAGAPPHGSVAIIGDAAIDQINVVERIPALGTSVWGDFQRHPGGKGLNRAVALARLGLDARLITAIGDDPDGRTVLEYLRRQRIDTSLIKVVPGVRTPVATVLMLLSGESATIAFKQDRIGLSAHDLASAAIRQAVHSCDAVLVTLEQSGEIVSHVLDLVRRMPTRPRVFLNVSPPTVLPKHLHLRLDAVDCVIGTRGEVAALWPGGRAGDTTERLLHLGVNAVCAIEGSRCTVTRSHRRELTISHFGSVAGAGAAGACSAFSAALAYRSIRAGGTLTDEDFAWATAAIVARHSALDIPGSMPAVTAIAAAYAHGIDRDAESLRPAR